MYHRIEMPMKMEGPIISEATADKFYTFEQFTASGCPNTKPMSLVGITDLADVNEAV